MQASLELGTARELRFAVAGVPISQGSKGARIVGRRVPFGGTYAVVAPRAVLFEVTDMARKTRPSGALKRWRSAVAACALARRQLEQLDIFKGPVELDAQFVLPRSPAHFIGPTARLKRSAPAYPGLPDLSKLIRAIEDAMSGVVYDDDRQVVRVRASKRYGVKGGTGGVIICVREIEL